MHQQPIHDTSTQAMTEVALGLSMAFFSLLILALFSIGLPDNHASVTADEHLKLARNDEKNATNNGSDDDEKQYVFYFNGQFYDSQLKPLNIQSFTRFDVHQPLIIAVQENIPLSQVMAVREQINHPNLAITMLDQKWQTQLQNIQ